MKADVRRLERASDDKRARAEKLDQRMNRVSNLREEAAVHVELDLLKRAIDADEHEALQLIGQIQRTEQTVEELGTSARAARAEVEPRQRTLRADRQAYSERMELLLGRRTEVLAHVGPPERRVYEAFHGSGRKVVVTSLLDDGACGHCFGVIPLQLQNEIRRREGLIRCENCGVILTTEPEPTIQDLEGGPELPPLDAPPDATASGSEGAADGGTGESASA
jgi:predicted  nucleic acid-binding Zn-ribbon protein